MGGCVASLIVRQSHSHDVPDWFILNRRNYGPLAIPSEDSEDGLTSPVYRSAEVSEEEHKKICKEWYERQNIVQRLERTCKERKELLAIAYRTVQRIEKEKRVDSKGNERYWDITHYNDPLHITYGQFWERLIAFGKGLSELGFREGTKIVLYEETRWEWLASILGAWTQKMVGATVYANLGESSLQHALKETECSVVVCNGKCVPVLLKLMRQAALTNVTIIYLDTLPDGIDAGSTTVVSWNAVLEKGLHNARAVKIPTDPDATALIMYTSGTVAEPKGVIHTFGSLNCGAAALGDRLVDLTGPKEDDETYLAYLPLAHILEFICEVIMLDRGSLLCYGSPRTLTDMTARPRGDLSQFKPMLFVGVPRIFDTIRKNVEAQLTPGSLKRTVFDAAYENRLKAMKDGKDTPYLNAKVFGVPRAAFGGMARGIVCGGAPLGDRTQEFMNVVFGIPMAQGYGLTESCCCASVQRTGELLPVAGQLLKSVEAKLLDTEEYKHTDKPRPRGELLLRGPFVFKGYYKQEERTKEAFLPNGWFRTGDIAEFDDKGCLHIVGRVKALAKNMLGEYIALEALEALYGQHPVVGDSICVLVNPLRAYICALVLSDETKIKTFATANAIRGTCAEILSNPVFHQRVAAELGGLAKKEGRRPFEILRHVRVLLDTWTPENGLITASMKIRRTSIESHYSNLIEELFHEE